jgi:hypothetical protein
VRLFISAIAVAATLLALPAASAGLPTTRNCDGHITSRDGAPAGVTIRRGKPTCTTARRVLRRYLHSDKPCEGSACVRKLLGWTCASASAEQYPRLASCKRAKSMIAAYAIADRARALHVRFV